MYTIKCRLENSAAFTEKLKGIGNIPLGKMKAALNHWRFSLATEINNSLANTTLHKRSGKLYRSVDAFKNLVVVQSSSNTLIVQFKKVILSYGAAHESGAEITPKTAKFLTIPLRAAPVGQAAVPIVRYKNTFIRKAKSSDNLVVWWKRRRDKPIPIFLLVKKLKMEERPWFAEAVERSLPSLRKIILQSRGEWTGDES